MSTDRELLELAAKAAGMEIVAFKPGRKAIEWAQLSCASLWNPLHDDGDALRLASVLLLDIAWETEYSVSAGERWCEDIKDHDNDRTTATRVAIVRAAAEIGRAMP